MAATPPSDPAPPTPEPPEAAAAPPSEPPETASTAEPPGRDAESLQDLLDAGCRLSVSQALLVGLEAARVLMRVHGGGRGHGGVEASNLVFDADGRVSLTDPDSARPPGDSPGLEADADLADPADDIRDLGLVISRSVTGAATAAKGEVPPPDETSVPDEMLAPDETSVDEALGPLQGVVARAVSPRPEDRPSVTDLVRDLIRTSAVLPRPEPFPLTGSSTADSAPASAADAIPEPHPDPASAMPLSKERPGPAPASTMPLSKEQPHPDPAPAMPLPKERPGPAPALAADVGPVPVLAPSAPRPAVPLDDTPRRRWPGTLLAVAVVLAAGIGAVLVWQSTVSELDAVPDLAGHARPDALAAVTALGWAPEVIQVREPGTEPGEVVRTEPEAGTELAPDRSLRLFVSLGEPLVPVPEVAGLSPIDAASELAALGLAVSGEVRVVPHDVHPPGTVVGVDLPSYVTELEPGAEVGLLVSDGPAPR